MNIHHHRPGGRARGFTLLEMMISVVLLTILLGSVTLATRRASDAFGEEAVNEDLMASVQRTTARIMNNLESAERSTLSPDPEGALGAEALQFRLAEGYADEAVTWSNFHEYRFELESAELDNGLDDDGDGLVDEGRVVWVQNEGQPGELTITLCTGVRRYLEGEVPNGIDDNGNGLIDEAGFCLSAVGNVLTVRLTCVRNDASGRTLFKTMESAVKLWN